MVRGHYCLYHISMIMIFDEINFWARLLLPRNANTKTITPQAHRGHLDLGVAGGAVCLTKLGFGGGWFQVVPHSTEVDSRLGEWPPREITQPAHCPVHPCHAPQPCQGPAQIQIQIQKYKYKYMTCTLATNAFLSCSLSFPMPSSTTYLCTSPSNLKPPVHIVHMVPMVHTHHVSWQVGMRDHRCNWPDALPAGLAL